MSGKHVEKCFKKLAFAESEEDPEDNQASRRQDKRHKVKAGSKRLNKQRLRQDARQFIDDAAEEDEDSELEGQGMREGAYYDENDLKRKNQPLMLAELENKYMQQNGEPDEDLDEDS